MAGQWHEFWVEHPPVRGMYLVTVSVDHRKIIDIDLWQGEKWLSYSKVRAWMELPEPYSIYDTIGEEDRHDQQQ